MNKNFKKTFSILLSLTLLFGVCSSNVFALSSTSQTVEPKAVTYYAYSIGVNHGTTNSGLSGNFVPNVKYANTCYGMINGITSYYNDKPTVSYMKGNNPAGVRRIASRVVWLNGHANNTTLVFNHNNLGGTYDTGVYYGYDTTKCAGLLSTSMSGVDLISFVGCETANGTTNLASRARSQGATTAIGFTKSITSRSTDGQGWCRKFNDALALGHTISSAISYATSFYPNADLDNYIKVYGSTTNKIASSGSVASLSDMSQTQGFQILNSNIVYKNIGNIQNKSLVNYSGELSNIISRISEYDNSFNIDDYAVTVNMYSEDGQSGIITFTYTIGDILTNKAYVATIENNVVTDIICNNVAVSQKAENAIVGQKKNINENSLKELVAVHKSRNDVKQNKTAMQNVVSEEENYYYDYNTNMLTYQKCVYCIDPSADNVIVDVITTEVLNNN